MVPSENEVLESSGVYKVKLFFSHHSQKRVEGVSRRLTKLNVTSRLSRRLVRVSLDSADFSLVCLAASLLHWNLHAGEIHKE